VNAFDDCAWHPVVRWLTFLPLGLLATSIPQGIIRLANPEVPFFADIARAAVEPWPFFLVALWVIPRFHRGFITLASGLNISICLAVVYRIATGEMFSAQPWADYTMSAVSTISWTVAARYFFVEIGGDMRP
jgi:hypothetical protein